MPSTTPLKSSPRTPSKDSLAARLLRRAHSQEAADAIHADKIKHKPLILYSAPTRAVTRVSSIGTPTLGNSKQSPNRQRDARDLRREARNAKLEAQGRRRSKKPKPLSARDKRRLCVYEMTEEEKKYSIYHGLHQMWCQYMKEVLGIVKPSLEPNDGQKLAAGLERSDKAGGGTDGALPTTKEKPAEVSKGRAVNLNPKHIGPLLTSADFHGGDLEVVRSRSVSRVGLRGIVVRDTKFTFEVITKNNEIKVLPKEHSIFRFRVPLMDGTQANSDLDWRDEKALSQHLIFELHGEQFQHRGSDRANKKFKWHIPPDL